MDSAPPNNISYFAYWFFLTVDVIFILTEYTFSQYILTNSGATIESENDTQDDDKSTAKKSKDEEEETKERTVPILVMFRKLTNWYKAEWLPLIAGYILLAVGTSGKRVLR